MRLLKLGRILSTEGELQPVLEFDLVEGRRLAIADPAVVRVNLVERGFHLQLPPTQPDPMIDG